MIDLGSTSFVIFVSPLSRDDLEAYSTDLFDQWDAEVASELELSDYALLLEIEEGSLKGRAKIYATVGVVIAGIATYDGFFAGIQRIESQVRAVSSFVAERAAASFPQQQRRPTVRRRRGALGQLQELFFKVQRREITVEQAMRQAEALLGVEATQSPEFMRQLEESLEAVPMHPEQLLLPMQLPAASGAELEEEEEPERHQPSPRQRPIAPPPERFRVEIWRESRKGKKSVTITVL